MKTIFEISQSGQRAFSLPKDSEKFRHYQPPKQLLRQHELKLPEISEIDITRHFSNLAHDNFSIDTNFYPLGSCTMKLNPKVNDLAASLPGFLRTHPLAPVESVQGNLELIFELVSLLCQITGMSAGSLLPNAGAQGEFIGARLIWAYHQSRGELHRNEMLIPDSAHGTNPATASLSGYKVVPVKTNLSGDIDLEDLRKQVSDRCAGLMLTNPNTLGLFSPAIIEISEIIHKAGGLMYCDGANMNAILNVARPAEMGFDVMHLNLHKTFSTPHGGGGPGAGPVLCNDKLKPLLPLPRVEKGYHVVWNDKKSIGQIASFYGNFLVYMRAFLYIKLHGHYGLRKIAEQAVLNANYLKILLADLLTIPFSQHCMHEFVAQADRHLDKGIRALDIAKRLLDYGIHPPTIYFPLTIKECMLIEPTESESKFTLDFFAETMQKIEKEILENPEIIKTAPQSLSVTRLNEVQAAKQPVLKISIE